MRLSLRKVYKRPEICGRCSYLAELEIASPPGSIEPNSGLQEGDLAALSTENSNEIAFWPQDQEESSIRADLPEAEFQDQIPDQRGDIVSSDHAEVELEKKAAIESAERIAEKILNEKLEQSLSEGYEQGKAKAENECRIMQEDAAARFRDAELSLREAKQRSKEIIASSERKIVELAVAVAERLIRSQLETEPDTVLAIVRETLNMLNGGEQIELFVNPADVEICLGFRDQFKAEFKEIGKLDILPDVKIPRGSCRIESENGVAEYLIDEEKEQLKETLLQIARKEEQEQIEEEDSAYGRH